MNLFAKYSFKQKKFALAVVFVLLAAAAYKRSFSVTLDLIGLNNELEEKKIEASTSVERLKTKQNELNLINRMVGKENVPNEQVQQRFLSFFEQESGGLSIEKIEEVYTYDHPDFTINTNAITLKGGFVQTTRFLYKLEKSFPYARLVSSTLRLTTNRILQKNELHTTILLQNFWRPVK